MGNYKLGIIITSINERTENQCIENFKTINKKDIHLVKKVYPSIAAFKKVCEIAIINRYDFIFHIDADVILFNDWLDIVNKEIQKDNFFYLKTFTIKDKYLGLVDRGHRFFNCKYFEELLIKINQNYNKILKSPKPTGFTNRYINGGLQVFGENRPEGIENGYIEHVKLEKPIGIHGYEQYYIDIYYRFYLHKIRQRNFKFKDINYNFLNENNEEKIIKKAIRDSNKDKIMHFYRYFTNDFIPSNYKNKSYFQKRIDIEEKKPLRLNRNEIFNKYGFL